MAHLVNTWQAARQELATIEHAEHPDIIDEHGRVWVWRSGDLYAHDDTLAFPADRIAKLGLPSPMLAGNPNYARLCDICRSQWPADGGVR